MPGCTSFMENPYVIILIKVILLPYYILGFLIIWACNLCNTSVTGGQIVGIFSRSAEDDYQWLADELSSQTFRGLLSDVRCCYIANNRFQEFVEQVKSCHVAILYHTKNRGRLNITDVPDSLYDRELSYLSDRLGRSKVIVVIDDLENSSEEVRSQILNKQPSIRDQACQLFLISQREKMQPQLLNLKMQKIKDTMSQGAAWDLCDVKVCCDFGSSRSSLHEIINV
uniref:Uncharacterized protein n=1 Tax=Leptobrachium leishanense TaxID=445787 RepID=A0A8C5QLC4_9ANUR